MTEPKDRDAKDDFISKSQAARLDLGTSSPSASSEPEMEPTDEAAAVLKPADAMPFVAGLGAPETDPDEPDNEDDERVWGNQVRIQGPSRADSQRNISSGFDTRQIATRKQAEESTRKSKKKRRLIVIGLLLAVLLMLVVVGLQTGVFSSIFHRDGASSPEAAVEDYYKGNITGDRDLLCDVMSPEARGELAQSFQQGNRTGNGAAKELSAKECKAAVPEKELKEMSKSLYASAPPVSQMVFTAGEEEGNEVTVKVEDSKHTIADTSVRVERYSGRWYVSPYADQLQANM